MEMSNRPDTVTGPDGGWGWMVTLASAIADAITGPYAYVMSPLFIELQREFNTSSEETAWVFSIPVFITYVFAFIGTSVSVRIGARMTVMAFSCLPLIGLYISYFATSIYFLYITAGVVTGIGFAGCMSPIFVTNARYFPNRYALAHGISQIGPAAGLFILPPITQACVNLYGWRGTFVVESAIVFNLCVCGALLRPLKDVQLPENAGDPNRCDSEHGNPNTNDAEDQHASDNNHSSKSIVLCCGGNITRLPPLFAVYLVSALFFGITYSGVMIHLLSRALFAQVGSLQQTSFLLSIIGICNLLGRLSVLLVHYKILSSLSVSSLGLFMIGIICVVPYLAETYAGFASFSAILGLASGALLTMVLICTNDLCGSEQASLTFPMLLCAVGLGSLLGPPFAGWIFDSWQNYNYVYYTLGSCSFVGSFILVPGIIRNYRAGKSD